MWSGGISKPLLVIEQLTYLLFIKRPDELQTLKEAKAARTGKPIEDPIFNKKQDHLRCSRFKEMVSRMSSRSSGRAAPTVTTPRTRQHLHKHPIQRVLANVVQKAICTNTCPATSERTDSSARRGTSLS